MEIQEKKVDSAKEIHDKWESDKAKFPLSNAALDEIELSMTNCMQTRMSFEHNVKTICGMSKESNIENDDEDPGA